MFCIKCGSLMYPEEGNLVCHREGCGFIRGLTEEDNALSRIATPAKEERPEPLILEEIVETLPKTRIECPNCGNFEAMWYMRQTRASDEPETRIYRCVRCSHTWREY